MISKEVVYKEAINTYGEIGQIDMTIEEMSELIQALSKYKRGREHNVEEEIADVQIMLEQMKMIFDRKKIRKIKRNKISRLAKRLRGEARV